MILSYLRKRSKTLFIGVVVVFLLGIFVGLGGYLFQSSDMAEAVAVVGSAKISFLRYQARVNQYLDALRSRGTDVTDPIANEVRQAMLRDMIVDEILSQEAKKLGIQVTDMELAAVIRSNPSFQRDGKFDQLVYFQALRQALRTTPEEFEREQRKTLLAAKLKQLVFQSVKTMPSEVADEYRRQNGGLKDFEKKRSAFASELDRTRSLDAINFFLKQVSQQMDIRQFLDQRMKGQ